VRILVAEDETIIRLDLRALLEHAGFDDSFAEPLVRAVGLDFFVRALDGEIDLGDVDPRFNMQRAAEAGVFGYLVKPFREQDLLPAIRTARARHEELTALREEAESLAEALAARKAIERAKGLLMEKEGLSEQDAFARLRKASQISGRPLKVVAEALIATFE